MITGDLKNRKDSAYRKIPSQISIIGYYTIDYTHFSLSRLFFLFVCSASLLMYAWANAYYD